MCPVSGRFTSAVATSISCTVPSPHPAATMSPAGLNRTLQTALPTFRGDPICSPVLASQIRIEKSLLPYSYPPPLAIFSPQGEKHTDLTGPVCPLIVDIRPPSSKFHSLMLASREQEATTLSSGWNATPVTVLPDSDRQQPSLTHRHTDAQWNSKHGCILGHDRNNQS